VGAYPSEVITQIRNVEFVYDKRKHFIHQTNFCTNRQKRGHPTKSHKKQEKLREAQNKEGKFTWGWDGGLLKLNMD